jgi:hypothetical protein
MESKEAERKRKLKILQDYIGVQLGSGRSQGQVVELLVGKGIPRKNALELVSRAAQPGEPPQPEESAPAEKTPQPDAAAQSEEVVQPEPDEEDPPVELKPEVERKILNYIEYQASQGASQEEIVGVLVEKGVPRSMAIELFNQKATFQEAAQLVPLAVPAAAPPALEYKPGRANEQALVYIAGQLEEGVDQKAIVGDLVEKGFPQNAAIDLVINAGEFLKAEKEGTVDAKPKVDSGAALKKIGIGLAFLFGGGCFTAASYAVADPGGTYWFFYGPMIYGFVYALMGFVELIRGH